MSDDYSGLHYRSVIGWPERLAREWPLLSTAFSDTPVRRLLDLGSGTGEHAAFLASHGYEVVGIDQSASMLDQARQAFTGERVQFVEGDLIDVASLASGSFGGAICLGNTLPHITDAARLERLFSGLRARLVGGAPFVLQILNYERIFADRQRYLPPTFRGDAADDLVFLRLMDPRPDGRTVVFCPTTLRYRREADPPLEILATRRVVLRGWRRPEIDEMLEAAGFLDRQAFGGYDRSAYDHAASPDLVVVAR